MPGRVHRARQPGGHELAARNAQIQRLVEVGAAMFNEHVLAGNTDIGRAVCHERGHVRGADHQQTQAGPVGFKDQLA